MSFVGGVKVSAEEFHRCWRKYDKDNNGFIEKEELDEFLRDMIERSGKAVTPAIFEEARTHYMKLLDENGDGKLDINELAKLMVPEESFLLRFRQQDLLTSVDFMEIWRKYDTDKNGYIEARELTGFIHDLLTNCSKEGKCPTSAEMDDYKEQTMKMFDANEDGKLDIKELARLLPVEKNFLLNFEEGSCLQKEDFERVFEHYDKDGSGSIEGAELEGLIKDLLECQNISVDYDTVQCRAKKVLEAFDANGDNKLQKCELLMLFGGK